MGKTCMTKTSTNDFKVTTPENSLSSQQAVTSKGISVPYTNLQLNPYPNTQLDLFCSDTLFFYYTAPSTWLTNSMRGSQYAAYSPTWERGWLQNSSVHHMIKFMKLLGYKILWYTNTTASSRKRWTRKNSISSHNLHEDNFVSHLRNLWWPLKQSLYMFKVVRKKKSPNMYLRIGLKSALKN